MNQTNFQELATKQSIRAPTRVVLTGARSAFIGPNLIFEPYRTAVATILVGLDDDIVLRRPADDVDGLVKRPVVVVPPDTPCELQSHGPIAILFCDALSDNFTEMVQQQTGNQIGALRSLLEDGPRKSAPEFYLGNVFMQLGVVSDRVARPEIMRVISALGREPERFSTVEVAAELAGLSPMRFQHVFTETVGLPFRRYRQWRRMGRVVRALAEGENLTSAAYAAGFSNSAHLSTAFKAMFGLNPSALTTTQVEYFLSDSEF